MSNEIGDDYIEKAVTYYKSLEREDKGYYYIGGLRDNDLVNLVQELKQAGRVLFVTDNDSKKEVFTLVNRNNGTCLVDVNDVIKVVHLNEALSCSFDIGAYDVAVFDLRSEILESIPFKEISPFFFNLRMIVKQSNVLLLMKPSLPIYSIAILNLSWEGLWSKLEIRSSQSFSKKVRWVVF